MGRGVSPISVFGKIFWVGQPLSKRAVKIGGRMNEKFKIKNEGWGEFRGFGVWRIGGRKRSKRPSSNIQRNFKHQGARVPGRRVTWLKNMKLRNEPILKMQESPDFTDVKWRFWR